MAEVNMGLYGMQIKILKMVEVAFEEYLNLPKNKPSPEVFVNLTSEQKKACLLADVKLESMQMFIVNYLTVLLGSGVNDKISIFNNQLKCKTEESKKFIKEYKQEFAQLRNYRNRVYSHVDFDHAGECQGIPNDFFLQSIRFVGYVLKTSKECECDREEYNKKKNIFLTTIRNERG